MNALPPPVPPVSRRTGRRAADLRRWWCLGLALTLCLPVCLRLRGQTAPGAATSDLPTEPPTEAPATTSPDGAPAPVPAATPPATPTSSLLIDPGATPAPLPTPNYNALSTPNAPRGSTGASLPPPPAGAGGPLPAEATPVLGAEQAANLANANDVRRFRYNFRLTLGATYSDNILLTTTGGSGDVYFTISPSIILGYGDITGGGQSNYIGFSYSPEALLYVDHPHNDALQHFIQLGGIYHLGQITLSGSQGISILDNTDFSQASAIASNDLSNNGTTQPGNGTTQPGTGATQPINNVNLDTVQRTRLNVYNTGLTGSYAYTDKTSLYLGLQISILDYQTLVSSESFSSKLGAEYALTGKINVGANANVGYVIQDDPNPDESFEQFNVSLSYRASEKFAFTGQVGLEVRQQERADGNDVNPIFTLGANYNPFDSTSLVLSASRQVSTSAISAEDYASTSLVASFSQRFFQKLYARLSLGYTNSSYTSRVTTTSAAPPPSAGGTGGTTPTTFTSEREDNYFFIQPALDYNLRDNLSVGAYYLRRENHSTRTLAAFENNQVGVHVSFAF